MARRPQGGGKRKRAGLGATLTPQGRAVLRAFHEARRAAPGFVMSCGVLPEISESASERLHAIVRDVVAHLDGQQPLLAVQRDLRRQRSSANQLDRTERNLTALIAAETTAAYLFGLSVGLAMHGLPERLYRTRR